MVIFLIWVGLVCCGAANGFIYDYVQAPQSYYYMAIPSIIAVNLLILHRVYTRNWYNPIDEIDPHHPSVFGSSAAISFIMGFCSLFTAHTGGISWSFSIGCLTAFLAFCVAAEKEGSYIW